MPRRKKDQPTPLEGAIEKAEHHTNGFNPAVTSSFVGRIENLYADIDVLKSEFMNSCKAIHADIKEVYQEAKDEAHLPKKELKAVVKARMLDRKAKRVREDMEPENQDTFDLIRQALGDLADTPLGQAASVVKDGKRQTMGAALREPGAPLDPDHERTRPGA